MARVLGKVIANSTVDGFSFISTKHSHARFVYVQKNDKDNKVRFIGEVTDRQVINPYFEKPTSIRYVEDADENIAQQSLYLAKVTLLASIQNGQAKEVIFPPLPGLNVHEAEEADIRLALHLEEKGIDIGFIKDYKLKFKVSPSKLLRTHISILGQTGSGKSYLAAKIAQELLKFKKDSSAIYRVAVPIIIDSSGEYSGEHDLGAQKDIAQIMKTIDIKDQAFPLLNEKYLPLLYEIYDIDEKQESDLNKFFSTSEIIEQTNQQQGLFDRPDIKEIIKEFRQSRISTSKQLGNNLENIIKEVNRKLGKSDETVSIPYKAISKMRKYNLRIKKSDDLDIVRELAEGLIVNLSEQDNYEERQIAVLLLLRQIYEAAKLKKLPFGVVIFIDEAHNYVPSVYKSFCKEEILRLAREGRKYGITLCLISQRPRWVDPTALSQCGNVFIFRIQNSDDKKHVFDSVSLPDSVKDANVAKFDTGEMIVAGDIVKNPMHCQVSEIDSHFISSIANRVKDTAMKRIKSL